MDHIFDVAVIGAGTAGRYAVREVRRFTKNFVLVNGGPMGTTCARVGCMPSKVAIRVAEELHLRHGLQAKGIDGGEALTLDVPRALAYVRKLRDGFVGGTNASTGSLLEGGEFVDGYARLVEPTVLQVEGRTIRARAVVLATGSRPVVPEAWRRFGDRILTTDTLFEQEDLPRSMAVVGLGAVGLELGQTLSRLGIEVTGVDALGTVGGLSDPEVARVAQERLGAELPLWLGAAAELEEAEGGRLRLRAGEKSVVVDKVLVAMGRAPNVDGLHLEALGVPLDRRGLPEIDLLTMQVPGLPVFFAGDLAGDRTVLHEASDEGRVAGHNAARGGEPVAFERKPRLVIAFTDPNLTQVGASWAELQGDPDVVVGRATFDRNGRARVMARTGGLLRVYGDRQSGRLLGAAMAAPEGEHLAHLLAWSIQQKQTVFDLLKMPFYHPVIEEALQNALYDLAKEVEARPEGPWEHVPARG